MRMRMKPPIYKLSHTHIIVEASKKGPDSVAPVCTFLPSPEVLNGFFLFLTVFEFVVCEVSLHSHACKPLSALVPTVPSSCSL